MSSTVSFTQELVERLASRSALPLMTQMVMQRLLDPTILDEIFAKHRGSQYEHELLFPVLVELMVAVVFGFSPSVHKSWSKRKEQAGVAVSAVYQKLKNVSPGLCAALVEQMAQRASSWIASMGGTRPALLPGHRVCILDGNHLAATERRIKPLRDSAAGPLPAVAVVAYNPDLDLPIHLVGDLDAYTQERALLGTVLTWVKAGDCWIGDRLYCVRWWLQDLADKNAFFVVRQHGNLTVQVVSERKPRGKSKDATFFEEDVEVVGEEGRKFRMRRIVVVLKDPTKHDEREILLLTNLPTDVADAAKVASLYRKRWSIEGAFHRIEALLQSELAPLGYPAAGLFGFSLALVAYQVLAVLEGVLRAEHGAAKVDEELSMHSMVEEIVSVWGGMMVLMPTEVWEEYGRLSQPEWEKELRRLGKRVDLSAHKKSKRKDKPAGPKAKKRFTKRPHISTYRALHGLPQESE